MNLVDDYCSYELAKLLKEKGFDEVCDHYIDNHWDEDGVLLHAPCKTSDLMFGYMCPTHQMAMKWLREVHNICIEPYAAAYRFGFTISKLPTGINICNDDVIERELVTYSEAIEAALNYALENLI